MTLASPRLRDLAQRTAAVETSIQSDGSCDLCGAPVPPAHRHVLDLDSGEPQCACRACAVLFDREQAGGGHYRLIPERRVRVAELAADERMFAAFGIPVDLAFVYLDSRSGRVVARYPGALGLIAAAPAADAWELAVAAAPALRGLQPDVEALLLHRGDAWLVPIDDCFRLAARVRQHWAGFTGGNRVWDEIARFFEELRSKGEEATWP